MAIEMAMIDIDIFSTLLLSLYYDYWPWITATRLATLYYAIDWLLVTLHYIKIDAIEANNS